MCLYGETHMPIYAVKRMTVPKRSPMMQLARTRLQLGAIIRRYRRQRGWTQSDLAAQAGVRQATISQIEAGKDVRYSTIADVFAALELELVVQPRTMGGPNPADIF